MISAKRLVVILFVFSLSGSSFGQSFFDRRTRRQNTSNRNSSCRVRNDRVVGQWRCDNGEVISCTDLCNGRPTCSDGSDETSISCRNVFCLDNAFRCSYGACIHANLECNGVQDCADNSDERTINCPGILTSFKAGKECGDGFFKCGSGECIYDDLVCSGGPDCKDGSDETFEVCSTHFCPQPNFRCDYGACVLRMARCDGKNDCIDGSDESEDTCGTNFLQEMQRPSNGTIIPIIQSTPISNNNNVANIPNTLPSPSLRPSSGSVLGANEYTKLIQTYRKLLYQLEIQVLELQQENLKLKYPGNTPGDILLDDLDLRPITSIKSPPQIDTVPPVLSVPNNNPVNSPPPVTDQTNREEGDCDAPILQGGRVSDVYNREFTNGFVRNGEMIVYECSGASKVVGVNATFCIRGSIIHDVPKCLNFCSGLPLNTLSVQATCHNPTGETIPCAPQLPARTIAILSCKVGYKKPDRVVPDAYTCMDDGNWNAHVYKCQQVCGVISQGSRFVVGGAESNITQVPWHAGIYENRNGRLEQICGGSIINPTSIVSAAHCFWDPARQRVKGPGNFVVAVGKTLRDYDAFEPSAQYFNVTQIDIYDQYRDFDGLFVSDIAVLVLENPIIFHGSVKPICVEYSLKGNERYVVSGIEGRVAGWGLTTSGGEPSPVLKTIDLPTVDFNTCLNESPPEFRPFITTDKFCAGFTTGESVCTGDSGGGMAFAKRFPDNTSAYYLRGIVSTGPRLEGSCDNNKYSAFTDIQLNIIFLYKYIVT